MSIRESVAEGAQQTLVVRPKVCSGICRKGQIESVVHACKAALCCKNERASLQSLGSEDIEFHRNYLIQCIASISRFESTSSNLLVQRVRDLAEKVRGNEDRQRSVVLFRNQAVRFCGAIFNHD